MKEFELKLEDASRRLDILEIRCRLLDLEIIVMNIATRAI